MSDPVDKLFPGMREKLIPQPKNPDMSDGSGIIGNIIGNLGGAAPVISTPATPAPAQPTAGTATNAQGTASDPFMQALLQQMEYVKPGSTTLPTSPTKVTVLPGGSGEGGGGSSAGPLILLVLVVVGVGIFFVVKKGKKHGHKEEKSHAQAVN